MVMASAGGDRETYDGGFRFALRNITNRREMRKVLDYRRSKHYHSALLHCNEVVTTPTCFEDPATGPESGGNLPGRHKKRSSRFVVRRSHMSRGMP